MKSILVVDPDEAVGSLLALALEQAGYIVTVVVSMEEAAGILLRSHFDLIVTEALDQNDPFNLDPVFLTKLKSLAPGTPIILCSVYPSVDYLPEGEHGLAGVVPKPFDIDDLLEKVSIVLKKSRAAPNGRLKW